MSRVYIADKETLDRVERKIDSANQGVSSANSSLSQISTDMQEVQENLSEIGGVLEGGVGGGIAPGNMKSFTISALDGSAKIWIKEPDDTVIDDQLLCTIAGVKIMRKDTEYPNTENAGILVLDLKREDFGKYADEPYEDSGLTNGKTYYYTAFPYSDYNVYNHNPSEKNRATATPQEYELYGYDIDQTDQNPATRVHYPDDVMNKDYEPATVNMTTGEATLGQWAVTFFIKETRPVMLKYDGTVDYELDHEDQTKKLDGTPSDISNTSYGGNGMVEFSKMYFRRWMTTDSNGKKWKHVRLCNKKLGSEFKCYQHMYDGEELDKIYLPMFEGSSVSSKVRSIAGQTPMNTQTGATEKTQIEANGTGWQFDDWADKNMIKDLQFLMGKSTDMQATWGNGHYKDGTAESSLLQTGTLKSKGAFYGTNGNGAVKFLWLENYYGDRWDRTYGCGTDSEGNVLVKMYPPYNMDLSGYHNTGIKITGTSGGYIKDTDMSEYGEIPTNVSGSETTYQPDGCWWASGCFLIWGGACNDGLHCGAAFNVNNAFSHSYWNLGPALAYKYPKAA